jgi:hypothetical protein
LREEGAGYFEFEVEGVVFARHLGESRRDLRARVLL